MLFLTREQIMQKTKAIIADDVDNDVLLWLHIRESEKLKY